MVSMNPFVLFMASPAGRLTRIAAGVALIVWGLGVTGGLAGVAAAVVGAIPLFAGLTDVCLLAPLFGNPLSGARIRAGR
jgi:hypothetical protein